MLVWSVFGLCFTGSECVNILKNRSFCQGTQIKETYRHVAEHNAQMLLLKQRPPFDLWVTALAFVK